MTDAEDAQRELDPAAGGQGSRHRARPGPGPDPGHQPFRHHHLGRPVPGREPEAAARFSFLLSIPAILGAGILKLDELSRATEAPAELAAGTAAAVSGFLAVSFLIHLLRTRTLWPCIWYRLLAGGLFVLLLAIVRS